MQRRYVFAALGIPLALVAGYLAAWLSGETYFRLGLQRTSWFMTHLDPLRVELGVTVASLALLPILGFRWGKRRDRVLQTALPARHAYFLLGFPLAIVAGVIAAACTAILSGPPGPTSWGANFAPMILLYLCTPLALIAFPLAGFLWGRQKDRIAAAKK
jgi:hypothetical protein